MGHRGEGHASWSGQTSSLRLGLWLGRLYACGWTKIHARHQLVVYPSDRVSIHASWCRCLSQVSLLVSFTLLFTKPTIFVQQDIQAMTCWKARAGAISAWSMLIPRVFFNSPILFPESFSWPKRWTRACIGSARNSFGPRPGLGNLWLKGNQHRCFVLDQWWF